MDTTSAPLKEWEAVLKMLPPERAQKARELGAFERPHAVKNSDDLLRLLCFYCWADLSLQDTAAAAKEVGLANISDVGVLKRLRHVSGWLLWMLGRLLGEKVPPQTPLCLPYGIQIVDASVITLPGSVGTDFRLHAQYSLLEQRLQSVQISDASEGEALTRFPANPTDLFLADRAYGHRAGLGHLARYGAKAVVRFAWNRLPCITPEGKPFDLVAALSSLGEGEYGDWKVATQPDDKAGLPSVSGRVVALPKTAEQTRKAQKAARRVSHKKGHHVSAQTLKICGYFFVFTTLSAEEAPPAMVLALYRFRWQIELAFKRLKSILRLDEVRAHQPGTVLSYLLCKLLAAVLMEDLTSCWVSFSP